MIRILHKDTKACLIEFDADSLSGMDLSGRNLRQGEFFKLDMCGVNLEGADLSECHFESVNLTGSNLRKAKMPGADFIDVDLSRSDLGQCIWTTAKVFGVNLIESDLGGAMMQDLDFQDSLLQNANLADTELQYAAFRNTSVAGADFRGSVLGPTSFFEIFDLHDAEGLDAIKHEGTSCLDAYTLKASVLALPDTFLYGSGYSADEIDAFRALYGKPIRFYSCFISHAKSDGDLADRLRADLMRQGISCWHYRHDMKGGTFWRVQISEAIKFHDKLILICSEKSLIRRNVVDEIVSAMERERETGKQKLFPIRMDDYILSDEMLSLADEMMAKGEWREDWVRHVRAYHVPDFSQWRDAAAYKGAVQDLIRDLKASS